MFSLIRQKGYEGRMTDEYVCTSSDNKPTTGVGNGDAAIEINTGKIYFFNADSSQWVEWGN